MTTFLIAEEGNELSTPDLWRLAMTSRTPLSVITAFSQLKKKGLVVRRTEYFKYNGPRVFRRLYRRDKAISDRATAFYDETHCKKGDSSPTDSAKVEYDFMKERSQDLETSVATCREWWQCSEVWETGPFSKEVSRADQGQVHCLLDAVQSDIFSKKKGQREKERKLPERASTDISQRRTDVGAVPFFECFLPSDSTTKFKRGSGAMPSTTVTFQRQVVFLPLLLIGKSALSPFPTNAERRLTVHFLRLSDAAPCIEEVAHLQQSVRTVNSQTFFFKTLLFCGAVCNVF